MLLSDRASQPVSLPLHLAFIMDGNRRWARAQGLPVQEGHLEGIRVAKSLIEEAAVLGIRYLSLFVLSKENLRRPVQELEPLMQFLCDHCTQEVKFYREKQIKVLHSGDAACLSPQLQQALSNLVTSTAQSSGMVLNLAIAYGGIDEMLRAIKRLFAEKIQHFPKQDSLAVLPFSEFQRHLDNPSLPPVDLLIRAGGEQRLSNFSLLQCAYTELYFHPHYWPQWTKEHLHNALLWYNRRERRFGIQ